MKRRAGAGAWARVAVVGLLWLFFCGWFVGRMRAAGMEMTLLNLMPIPISGAIVFIPLYKKYFQGTTDTDTAGNPPANRNANDGTGKSTKKR